MRPERVEVLLRAHYRKEVDAARTAGGLNRPARARAAGRGWARIAVAAGAVLLPLLMILGQPTAAPLAHSIDRLWETGGRTKVVRTLGRIGSLFALDAEERRKEK